MNEVAQEARALGFVSHNVVNAIARRLQLTYKKPYRKPGTGDVEYAKICVLPHEFPVVVELALAEGHNPLSRTFHYWKQDGELAVMDHYAPLVKWAQGQNPFKLALSVVRDSGEKGGWTATATSHLNSNEDAWQKRFQLIFRPCLESGAEVEEAIAKAREFANELCVSATGRVEYNEVYYDDGNPIKGRTPKGWTPGETRAEVRAIRNLIKRAFGMPSASERWEMAFGHMSPRNVLSAIAEMPQPVLQAGDEVQQEYMQLVERVQDMKEEMAEMTTEEKIKKRDDNVARMRNTNNAPIGEDWQEEAGEIIEVIEGVLKEDPYITADPASGFDLTLAELGQYGYEGEVSVDGLSNAVYGNKFEYLDYIQRWNLIQYAKRKVRLDKKWWDRQGEKAPAPAERPALIPDLKGVEYTSLAQCADILKEIARKKSQNKKLWDEFEKPKMDGN